MSIPEIESIDYTIKEYLNFVQHIQNVARRLNTESESTIWSAHRVELAIWTHYVITKLQPELLREGSPGKYFSYFKSTSFAIKIEGFYKVKFFFNLCLFINEFQTKHSYQQKYRPMVEDPFKRMVIYLKYPMKVIKDHQSMGKCQHIWTTIRQHQIPKIR